MNKITRRAFTFTALAGAGVTSACGNGIGGAGAGTIDQRVDATLNFMFNTYPNTRSLADKANGLLVMPLVTEAGFGFGAGYGRGALRVGNTTVDYYSTTKGSFGLQIGAQQYAHVLFFMTEGALTRFRRSNGWAAGADIEYVFKDQGENIRAETTTSTAPVLAVIFGQAGLLIGATLEGQKYSRIIP